MHVHVCCQFKAQQAFQKHDVQKLTKNKKSRILIMEAQTTTSDVSISQYD